MENFYARQVRATGDGGLLRQAFVDSFGHCNFSPAELVAGVLALGHRVTTVTGTRRPTPAASIRWPPALTSVRRSSRSTTTLDR